MDSAVVTSTLPGESKGEELKELFESWRLAVKEALQVKQRAVIQDVCCVKFGQYVHGVSAPGEPGARGKRFVSRGKAVQQVCGSAPGVSCVDLQPGAS